MKNALKCHACSLGSCKRGVGSLGGLQSRKVAIRTVMLEGIGMPGKRASGTHVLIFSDKYLLILIF